MGKATKTKTPKQHIPHLNQWVLFGPLMIILGIIPLIVRLNMLPLTGEISKVWTQNQVADFFSWYKSNLIILAVLVMIGIFAYYLSQGDKLSLDNSYKMAYGCGIVFLILGLLSTFFSQYSNVAWWGAPERCEGMVMLICYVAIMFYALYAFRKTSDFKFIIAPLCFVTAVNAFLGVFQFFGHDLFDTQLGRILIIPGALAALRDNLTLMFEEGKIYGTLFHYNYMGSFGAMMAPLFITLALFLKDKKAKILFGMMSFLALFLLFGSTSRAGIIGFGVAIIAFIIIFAKKIIEQYKITLVVIIAFIAFAFGLNVITSGAIFARIPTLINDAQALFDGGDGNFNYKDHLPINDIIIDGRTITFVMPQETLSITSNDNDVIFRDKAGQRVNYILSENVYTTTDERFGQYSFEATSAIGENIEIPVLAMAQKNQMLFIIALDQEETYLVDGRFNKINLVDPKTIGFNGQEKLGSARGYIWSRSLPIAMDSLFIGKGPDTFILNFPQGDLLGKWYAYGTPWMTVDKPHNLYLQIWISQGALALIAFLVLTIGYLAASFKRYAFRKTYTAADTIGTALALAVAGYLGAGVFNDSIVSVAPIFWAILGVGIAVNRVNKEQQTEQ